MDNRLVTVQKPNLLHSFRPTYFVSRVFGLMPFSIVSYPNGDIGGPKVGIFDGLWFAISLSFYTCGVYVASTYQIYNQTVSNISVVLTIGYTVCFLLGLMLGFISIISDMGNRVKLVNIVKNFAIFDQEVNKKINDSFSTRGFELNFLEYIDAIDGHSYQLQKGTQTSYYLLRNFNFHAEFSGVTNAFLQSNSLR